MRVSTSMMFTTMAESLSSAGASVEREMERIAEGKQRTAPSDNPIDAAESIRLSASIARYGSSKDIAGRILDKIAETESFAQTISDELVAGKEILVQAGNGTLSKSELRSISERIIAIRDGIAAAANGQHSDGTYAFSGFSNAKPFPGTSFPATYVGDQGENTMIFADGMTMKTNFPGQKLFGNNDILGNLTDLAQRLANGDTSTLTNVISSLDASIFSSSETLSELGNRGASLETEITTLDRTSSELSSVLSHIDDLDYAQAISELTKKQTIYQAGLKAFAQISHESLFSIL